MFSKLQEIKLVVIVILFGIELLITLIVPRQEGHKNEDCQLGEAKEEELGFREPLSVAHPSPMVFRS